MAALRTIHIFMASPGDLAVERRAFKEVIDELNQGFGGGTGVKFVRWAGRTGCAYRAGKRQPRS
jgi:hypothetical protein